MSEFEAFDITYLFRQGDQESEKQFLSILERQMDLIPQDAELFLKISDNWLRWSNQNKVKAFELSKDLLQVANDYEKFELHIFQITFMLECLQFEKALALLNKMKLQNKVEMNIRHEIEICLQKARLYQLEFNRHKALQYLYKADRLIKAFEEDENNSSEHQMRKLYHHILIDINIQNKELIYAHQVILKTLECYFEQQTLDIKLRLAQINYYMDDISSCEECLTDIITRINEGQTFTKSLQAFEFLNLLLYFFIKQEKMGCVERHIDQVIQFYKKNTDYFSTYFNMISLHSILSYISSEYQLKGAQQDFLKQTYLKKQNITQSFLALWEKDPNYIQNLDYSCEQGASLLDFMQLFKDPLIYERTFQSQNPEYYQNVFGQFMILLRTSPLERISLYLSAIAACQEDNKVDDQHY